MKQKRGTREVTMTEKKPTGSLAVTPVAPEKPDIYVTAELKLITLVHWKCSGYYGYDDGINQVSC